MYRVDCKLRPVRNTYVPLSTFSAPKKWWAVHSQVALGHCGVLHCLRPLQWHLRTQWSGPVSAAEGRR